MTKDTDRDEKIGDSKLHEAPKLVKETLEDLDALDSQAVKGGDTTSGCGYSQCQDSLDGM